MFLRCVQQRVTLMLSCFLLMTLGVHVVSAASFADFDQRAHNGERLNVVFFGCSLTWGANASNPNETSYRGIMRNKFDAHYPKAHFRYFDAAIGGTNSKLGAFRVERDVLAHDPDIVFVDFTANDGINEETPDPLSAYESILRRFADKGIPVVQVAFPFKWDIKTENLPKMKRLIAHRNMAEAYGNGWGDVVSHICAEYDNGKLDLDTLWVTDGVHPHDAGYAEFAKVAWDAYLGALKQQLAPRVPEARLHQDTFATINRFKLASAESLPLGWSIGQPHLTAINFDWLMSRWLDDIVIASNRTLRVNGTPGKKPAACEPLRLKIQASYILLYGESSKESANFKMKLNGEYIKQQHGRDRGSDIFVGNRWKDGNGFLIYDVATGLDASQEHILEIEPLFTDAEGQNLRIESVCVAGGPATVDVIK